MARDVICHHIVSGPRQQENPMSQTLAPERAATVGQQSNPYLSGNFAPVARETTAFDLKVRGHIPPELEGRLLRNGPNPVGRVDPAHYHWFDGTGMVHGLRLRGGRAE
jgi:carotenoid cleavage dioxygenase-like enzyme